MPNVVSSARKSGKSERAAARQYGEEFNFNGQVTSRETEKVARNRSVIPRDRRMNHMEACPPTLLLSTSQLSSCHLDSTATGSISPAASRKLSRKTLKMYGL